jgi:glycosyltransferase involved in cell wall biosynthesis
MTPDVMHVQHEYGLYGPQKGVEIIQLILLYRLAGIPVVTTLHTVHEELNEKEHRLLKHIVDESSAIIVHEAFQKETLVRHFGNDHAIHIIEHGIRDLKPIADAKSKLGLEGKKVILLSGYFRPTKGFHKVVDRFSEIAERDPNVVLVVAGKERGIEFDAYRRELFTKLNASPYADRIRILRGQFPQYTFDTIMSAADVVVLPYEKGGQSGILSQCFALQRPVVVSNLPAFRTLLERVEAGLLCESDEQYPDRILQLLDDQALQRRCRTNIQQYVREHAAWRHIAGRHIDVYHSVITVPYGKAEYVYFPEPAGYADSSGEDRPVTYRPVPTA